MLLGGLFLTLLVPFFFRVRGSQILYAWPGATGGRYGLQVLLDLGTLSPKCLGTLRDLQKEGDLKIRLSVVAGMSYAPSCVYCVTLAGESCCQALDHS